MQEFRIDLEPDLSSDEFIDCLVRSTLSERRPVDDRSARFPVGLWLLRWVSIGKTPTVEDMVSIVVSLERGQGATPLSGQLHQTRLRMLSDSDDLIRLAIWYAR